MNALYRKNVTIVCISGLMIREKTVNREMRPPCAAGQVCGPVLNDYPYFIQIGIDLSLLMLYNKSGCGRAMGCKSAA